MSTKPLPSLAPAETEILRLVWQLGEASVQKVCEHLPADRPIAYATVQTLLRRLEAKGYVAHHTHGKAHIFYALVAREKVIARTVRAFVQRLFGGDPAPLMLHLAEESNLQPEDIERLRQLMEKNRSGRLRR